MMKFFRKHQKGILLLMVALMVLFIAGSIAFDVLSNVIQSIIGGRAKLATIELAGETVKIKPQAVSASNAELEVLHNLDRTSLDVMLQKYKDYPRELLGYIAQSMPSIGKFVDRYLTREGGAEDAETWYLWKLLVQHYAIQVTDGERDEFMKQCNITPEVADTVRQNSKMTRDAILETIRQVVAMQKLETLMQATATNVSEHDVQVLVRDLNRMVKLDMVRPDFEAIEKAQPAPSQEDIQAQFDRFKDRFAGNRPFDFGYRVPSKVALEFLVIDTDEVARRPELLDIQYKDDDGNIFKGEDAVYRYWAGRKASYTKSVTVVVPPTTQPEESPTSQEDGSPTSQDDKVASTQPAATPQPQTRTESVPKTFAEAASEVRIELANRPDPTKGLSPAESYALDELRKAVNEIEAWPGGAVKAVYRDYGGNSKDTVEAKLGGAAGLDIFRSPMFADSDWSGGTASAGDLTRTRAFRTATRLTGGQQTLRTEAFNVKELVGDTPLPGAGSPRGVMDQRDEIWRDGSRLFIWRVIGARKDHAPEEITPELSGQIVKDIVRRKAYDMAKDKIQMLQTRLQEGKTLVQAVDVTNQEIRLALPQAPTTQPATTQPEQPIEYLSIFPTQVAKRFMSADWQWMGKRMSELQQQNFPQDQMLTRVMIEAMLDRDQQTGQPDPKVVLVPYMPLLARTPKVTAKAFELAEQAEHPAGGVVTPSLSAVIEDDAIGMVAEEPVLVLIQYVGTVEPTQAQYEQDRFRAYAYVAASANIEFQRRWYSPTELRARLKYQKAESTGRLYEPTPIGPPPLPD
ncbi:MAG: hypothetical protein BIFFINMI_01844 [Phycisphaerae bacterium]|nr:hypothetical protein [Phycisphaerae bacterium]